MAPALIRQHRGLHSPDAHDTRGRLQAGMIWVAHSRQAIDALSEALARVRPHLGGARAGFDPRAGSDSSAGRPAVRTSPATPHFHRRPPVGSSADLAASAVCMASAPIISHKIVLTRRPLIEKRISGGYFSG